MESVPGLDDHLVAVMADRNHRPTEQWIDMSRLGRGREMTQPRVICDQCCQAWPCATRLALRKLGRGYP